MTNKQAQILEAALSLFAQEGYHATSTSKVARRAGVSEGLIFRHFQSKEGLLQAILDEGEGRFEALYASVLGASDPQERLRRALSIPFQVPAAEYDFWRLQFKLKWELGYYRPERMAPFLEAVAQAFAALGHGEPEQEAVLLLALLDGVGGALLKGGIERPEAVRMALLRRYGL